MRRGAWLLGCLLAVVVAAPAVAAADPTVTFVAPPGARYYSNDSWLRTADPRPVIGIEADGGAQLQCRVGDDGSEQPCGPPLPGCVAVLCASYQPQSPLAADSTAAGLSGWSLGVDVLDAGGSSLASGRLAVDFDTTPPVTSLASSRGIVDAGPAGQPDPGDYGFPDAFRPSVTVSVADGQLSQAVNGDRGVDSVECSWTASGNAPAWHPCPEGEARPTAALPHRHRLYVVKARGTDDLGRSTVASAVYDPIPCILSIRRPANLATLIASGVTVHVHCDATYTAQLTVAAFALNGHRGASPQGAIEDNPVLGKLQIHSGKDAFDVRRRVRLNSAARHALRQARSAGLAIAVVGPSSIFSYRAFTVGR